MDVVFEGSLSGSWGMKDVLQAVIDVPNVQNGLLRVSCPNKGIQGKILISDANHIVGAACNSTSNNDSYEALRALLDLSSGNFAFLDLSCQAQTEFDASLYICISRLLNEIANLPNSSSLLFDQESLLDKIFGNAASSSCTAAPSPANPGGAMTTAPSHSGETEESPKPSFTIPIPRSWMRKNPQHRSSHKPAAAPITQWNILEPLFQNPQATLTEHIDCSPESQGKTADAPKQTQTADDQRSSMVRLRALPVSSSGCSFTQKTTQPIKWLLTALGISVLFLSFAIPQLWHSSSTTVNNTPKLAETNSLSR